jgi:hypothetical protein
VVHSVKDNLLAAIRHVLRPLCRIAIRNGIGFADLSMALQNATVSAARAELSAVGTLSTLGKKELSGKELSDEEVGLMAGMTAQQVRGIHGTEASSSGALNYSWAASEVLSGWHSDAFYLGPYGLLLDIPFSSVDSDRSPDARSFEALVRKYAGANISAEIVLDALLKAECVLNLGSGTLRCVARTYIAEQLSPENIQVFAEAVHNVIGTMAVNLKRTVRGTGLIQRTVFADYGLSEEDLAKFNGFIRRTGEKFTNEVDTWFVTHSNKERQGPIKTGVGLYHYVENDVDREDYLELLKDKGVVKR